MLLSIERISQQNPYGYAYCFTIVDDALKDVYVRFKKIKVALYDLLDYNNLITNSAFVGLPNGLVLSTVPLEAVLTVGVEITFELFGETHNFANITTFTPNGASLTAELTAGEDEGGTTTK